MTRLAPSWTHFKFNCTIGSCVLTYDRQKKPYKLQAIKAPNPPWNCCCLLTLKLFCLLRMWLYYWRSTSSRTTARKNLFVTHKFQVLNVFLLRFDFIFGFEAIKHHKFTSFTAQAATFSAYERFFLAQTWFFRDSFVRLAIKLTNTNKQTLRLTQVENNSDICRSVFRRIYCTFAMFSTFWDSQTILTNVLRHEATEQIDFTSATDDTCLNIHELSWMAI